MLNTFFNSFQRSWLENNPLYRKINLYYRIFHPLTTTGLAPCLFLIVLNVRICIGLKRLRESQERRLAQNTLSGVLPREGRFHNMQKIFIKMVDSR